MSIQAKIHEELQSLERQIRDAKEDILRCAQLYARSAEVTLRQAEDLADNRASGICSTSFRPSGVENGTAAYSRLMVLVEKRSLLQFLIREEGE